MLGVNYFFVFLMLYAAMAVVYLVALRNLSCLFSEGAAEPTDSHRAAPVPRESGPVL